MEEKERFNQKEYNKVWMREYNKRPEVKKRHKRYNHSKKRKEKMRKYMREYYKKNQEKLLTYQKEWYYKNNHGKE